MEEASQASTNAAHNPNPNPNPNNSNSIVLSTPVWPTIDGPLGLSEEDSLSYARRFYKYGYALLPFLWAINCFYFWPVLRHSRSFPRLRPCALAVPSSLGDKRVLVLYLSLPLNQHSPFTDVVRSAVGFTLFSALLSSWALVFATGGEHLFGPIWDKLVMYNVADWLGLTGWS